MSAKSTHETICTDPRLCINRLLRTVENCWRRERKRQSDSACDCVPDDASEERMQTSARPSPSLRLSLSLFPSHLHALLLRCASCFPCARRVPSSLASLFSPDSQGKHGATVGTTDDPSSSADTRSSRGLSRDSRATLSEDFADCYSHAFLSRRRRRRHAFACSRDFLTEANEGCAACITRRSVDQQESQTL